MSPDPTRPLLSAVLSLDLPARCRVLVAVSGGPDSVALLLSLHRAQVDNPGWELAVGHVDHHLRPTSPQDAHFVTQLANSLRLPCLVTKVDTPSLARSAHISLETAARQARYRALRQMLATWQGDVIALGHTRDDQAETVLMRLLRGTGPSGLTAMSPRTDDLIRPFLTVSRAQILAALQAWGIRYRTDESNDDETFTRNRIRHRIMPALRSENPAVASHLAELARASRIDNDFLDCQVDRAAPYALVRDRDGAVHGEVAFLLALHPAVTVRLLRRALSLVGLSHDVDATHLLALHSLLTRSSGAVPLPSGLRFTVRNGTFTLERPSILPNLQRPSVPLPIPGSIRLETGTLTATRLSPSPHDLPELLATCGPWHALLDEAALLAPLTVRVRNPGDRIACLPQAHTRRLQDIFVDARIPVALRASWPVISAADRILWLPGLTVDLDARARLDSSAVVHLYLQPETNMVRGRMPRLAFHLFP